MFMQSNQPFQQDSVLDGALLGGAIGAGAMYGAYKAAPAIQDWNKADTKKNASEYTKQLKTESARQEKLVGDTRQKLLAENVKSTPSATAAQRSKAIAPKLKEAVNNMDPSQEMKKAQQDLKFNNKVDKASKWMQGGSSRNRAVMYGGSVIAGALGGAMIDKGN